MRGVIAVSKLFQVATMVLCLLFGLVAAGCGPLTTGRNVPAATPEPQPEMAAGDEDTLQSDGEMMSDGEMTGDPVEPVSETSTPAPVPEPVWGYRVQLYSFTNRDSAEAALKQVERSLAEWPYGVYLNEESNSFKVRVGDFMEKADADRLRDSLRSKGFPDAWTASAWIQPPQAP